MLIRERVDRVLRDQLGPGMEWTEASRLEEDLTLDSIDRVELTLRLEEEFGFDIPDDDSQFFFGQTVGQVAEVIERLAATKPALFA